MFQRLQQKWKVNGLQLVLILCTFAIGGSLTGFAGRKLMNFIAVEQGWLWIVIYIIMVTLLWPVAVLLVSVFFGQYKFFISYLEKIGRKDGSDEEELSNKQLAIGNKQNEAAKSHLLPATHDSLTPTDIAIFASGAGSNAQKIIDHFRRFRSY